MTNIPASTGWTWLKAGAGLCRKQAAALSTLLFANVLVFLLITAVPMLGKLLALLLIPSLSMAFMQACLMIENGERVTPAVLLTGFRKPLLVPLCKIGLIYVGASLLLTLLTTVAVDPAFWQQIQQAQQERQPGVVPQVNPGDMLAVFGIAILDIAVMVALSFAAPLTCWQQMSTGKATFYSFFAVVKNLRVFIVLLLALFAIFIAGSVIFTLLLGNSGVALVAVTWLTFLCVMLLQCALYVGYRQIFGKPDGKPVAGVSLKK